MLRLNRPVLHRLAACGLLVMALAGCSKRRFHMPSGSMIPTFPVDADFLADTSVKTPARGEIWVFRSPEHPEQEFVKRVVGLPGDRVEMKGDELVVNGKAVSSCTVGAYTLLDDHAPHPGHLVLEKSDAAAYLTFLDDSPAGAAPASWTVGPGEFFLVGDNRKNSFDSRFWNGGRGGGAAQSLLIGRVDSPKLALPAGAEGLAGALAKCKTDLGVSP